LAAFLVGRRFQIYDLSVCGRFSTRSNSATAAETVESDVVAPRSTQQDKHEPLAARDAVKLIVTHARRLTSLCAPLVMGVNKTKKRNAQKIREGFHAEA
jgi:hypothetical protein